MTAGGADGDLSADTLLGGRVRLLQPRRGFRAAIDPAFLAAAVPARPGETVLELGAGVGAALLCLAWRCPDCRLRGLERQPDLAALGAGNIALNGWAGRAEILAGDLLRPPPGLAPGSFDHVMANPPFRPAGEGGTPPAEAGRLAARVEGEAALADWVRVSLAMVRPKGSLTFIYRADRLEALLCLLGGGRGGAGEIVLFPLWPGAGQAARRVLLRARKGVAAPTRLASGLVLHESDGRYSAAAEAVLRDGQGLAL